MSKNLITVKYKVNVTTYCNWYNLDNLGLEEDEVETDILALKDVSGVIEEIKGHTIRAAEEYSGSIEKHSFQISSDENEILFSTSLIYDEDEEGEFDMKFYFNIPEDGEDEGRLGKWENENGESVNPMEIVE